MTLNDHFETKIINRLCTLLRAEQAAAAEGNAEGVMLWRAQYKGFTDALSLILSGAYRANLIRKAIGEVDGDG